MIPDKYIDLIRNSGAGHWAVVYAMYKLCTPIRYTVTVGKLFIYLFIVKRSDCKVVSYNLIIYSSDNYQIDK